MRHQLRDVWCCGAETGAGRQELVDGCPGILITQTHNGGPIPVTLPRAPNSGLKESIWLLAVGFPDFHILESLGNGRETAWETEHFCRHSNVPWRPENFWASRIGQSHVFGCITEFWRAEECFVFGTLVFSYACGLFRHTNGNVRYERHVVQTPVWCYRRE